MARIAAERATWNELEPFGLGPDRSLRVTLHAWDGVIRSKLVCSFVSLHSNHQAQRGLLDTFHLKGLRHILHMKAPFL